jgi:hypothetical protein
MPICRVQAIFDHDNGLPRDQACSTFHFDVASADDADAAATDVVEFYSQVIAGQARALGTWMSPLYDNVYAKAYMVDDVLVGDKVVSNSGPPVAVTLTASLGAKMDLQPLPAEVALCMSFRSNTVPTIPKARRTGRIYFGPLNKAAIAALNNNIARPTTDLTADLRLAAERLKDNAITHGYTWGVYSRPYAGRDAVERPGRTTLPALPARPNGTFHAIDQVWTDDAFDTQRRRGERATAKTIVNV